MGHTLSLEWQAVWKILVVGIILGAGLPALFATGIRSLAFGTGGEAEEHTAGGGLAAPHPIGRAIAYLCFAVVLLIVVLGIVYIVVTGQGKVLNFDHVYPMIQDKK
jgi:hypothetical protein